MIRRITCAAHRRVPWRNGGGTTSEILVEPPFVGDGVLAAGERFRHRVSIADVERDGPFSRFEGYDRHIVLLSGAGMRLDCGAHGQIVLRPHVAHAFAGEWPVFGYLESGPVRDFNLMVDRAHAASSLEVVTLRVPTAFDVHPGTTCIVHVARGSVDGAEKGDTLVLDGDAELVPHDEALLLVARVAPIAPGR